jgi:hypothetical protein
MIHNAILDDWCTVLENNFDIKAILFVMIFLEFLYITLVLIVLLEVRSVKN